MKRTLLAASIHSTLMAVALAAVTARAQAQDAPVSAEARPAAESAAGAPASVDAQQGGITEIDAVQVTGQRAALRRSQVLKQDSATVIDAISAEEVGKFPDQNVADALQRVPGVAVDRSGGESNRVTVRGLGPQFVSITLNGRSMVSDSGNREFNFDTLPSELISTLEVQKTSSADTVDGAIGGSINIVTARPLDSKGFHVAGSLGAVNDSLDGGLDSTLTPKGSFVIGNSNEERTFGWLLSGMYYKRKHESRQITAQGWYVNQDFDFNRDGVNEVENASWPETIIGNYNESEAIRKGISAAIDWKPTDKLTIKFDTLYSNYERESLQHGLGFYGNKDDIKSIQVDGNNTATQYVRGNTGVMATDFTLAPGLRDAKLMQTGLNLSYQINDSSKLEFDWATSKAWNKTDYGNGYLVVGTRNTGFTPRWTNPGGGNLPYYNYGELTPSNSTAGLMSHCCSIGGGHLSNKLDEYKLDFSKSFLDGTLSKLDIGAVYADRTYRNIDMGQDDALNLCGFYCGYNSTAPADAIGAHVLDAGSWFGKYSKGFPTQWISYDPDKYLAYLLTPESYNQLLAKGKSPEDIAKFAAAIQANGGTWKTHPILRSFNQVQEKTQSFYIKTQLEGEMWSKRWLLDVGVRHTKTDTTSMAFLAPLIKIEVNPSDTSNAIGTFGNPALVEDKASYAYWLPSANFKLNLRDNLIFRFAASRTLTRPNQPDLQLSAGYNFRPSNQTVSTGNIDLKPYLSTNLDVGLEWYINDDSYIALEAFHKKISNFTTRVDTQTTILGFPFTQTLPVNLNEATVKGWELSFAYQFTALPAPFDGLGVAANYTAVDSDASIDESILSGAGRFAIPGIGDSANFSVFYEKGPWQARLAYNWRDEYLSCLSCGVGSQPETTKSYGQLDMSASYEINENVSVWVDGTNLTEETLQGYMVYPNRPTFVNYEGRTFTFGVRAKW